MKAEGFNTIRVPFNYRLREPRGHAGGVQRGGVPAAGQHHPVVQDERAWPCCWTCTRARAGSRTTRYADPEWTYWYWSGTPAAATGWSTGVAVPVGVQRGLLRRARAARRSSTSSGRWTSGREIAARYSDEPAILGYELINEPFLPYGVTGNDLRDSLVRITAAIREVDTNHIVFVEGNYFAELVEGLVPPWDDNMVLCFHQYWASNGYSRDLRTTVRRRDPTTFPSA